MSRLIVNELAGAEPLFKVWRDDDAAGTPGDLQLAFGYRLETGEERSVVYSGWDRGTTLESKPGRGRVLATIGGHVFLCEVHHIGTPQPSAVTPGRTIYPMVGSLRHEDECSHHDCIERSSGRQVARQRIHRRVRRDFLADSSAEPRRLPAH